MGAVTFLKDNGFMIHPTLSTVPKTVPSFGRSLIAKRMADQTMSTSSTDGSPLLARHQGIFDLSSIIIFSIFSVFDMFDVLATVIRLSDESLDIIHCRYMYV